MSRKTLPVDIYGYHDYRTFLYDLYRAYHGSTYRFTYTKFSRMAGFTTPNFLKDIIDGKRNLGPRSIQRICAGFDFNKGETEYFENLVLMNQAGTHEEKDRHYRRLGRAPRYQMLHRDDRRLYRFYSRWYYPVIRELVTAVDFRDDPAWIAERITPSITPAEAKRAMDVLEQTGQIRHGANGKWEQAAPVMTTGRQIESLAVAKYHKAMISLAGKALGNVSHEQRNISSLTMAVSPETYNAIVREVLAAQQRIIELVSKEDRARDVYQLNFQLFPLTRAPHKEQP